MTTTEEKKSSLLTNLFVQAMMDQYILTGNGFLIVYSISSRASFLEVRKFYDKIMLIKDEDHAPMVLVANKCDLPDDVREVTAQEGAELARELRCPFFEASAKERTNLERVFEEAVREIRKNDISFQPGSGTPSSSKKAGRKAKCTIL
jgi:GTPase KRas protein